MIHSAVVLAVALLRHFWAEGKVGSAAAVGVLDKALSSGRADLEDEAASLLAEDPSRLVDGPALVHWPPCVYGRWNPKMLESARWRILMTCLDIIRSRHRDEWDRGMYVGFVITLNIVRTKDPVPSIKADAALGLVHVIRAAQTRNIGPFIGDQAQGRLDLRELRVAVERHAAEAHPSNLGEHKAEQLSRWAEGKEPAPQA